MRQHSSSGCCLSRNSPAESFKEQEARQSKTLTALGSYWKGRKPLILNKACILGCLLSATADPARDLEIHEKLMAMDDESFVVRWKRRPKPKEVLATVSIGILRTIEMTNRLFNSWNKSPTTGVQRSTKARNRGPEVAASRCSFAGPS